MHVLFITQNVINDLKDDMQITDDLKEKYVLSFVYSTLVRDAYFRFVNGRCHNW